MYVQFIVMVPSHPHTYSYLQNAGKKYSKTPLDDRHLVAKHRKAKKSWDGHRPSFRDFPQDWLPKPPQKSESSAES